MAAEFVCGVSAHVAALPLDIAEVAVDGGLLADQLEVGEGDGHDYTPDMKSQDIATSEQGKGVPADALILNDVTPSEVHGRVSNELCSNPILDLHGNCHCDKYEPAHVPVLLPRPGRSFPPCRDTAFRALYIDDSILQQLYILMMNVFHSYLPLVPMGNWRAVDWVCQVHGFPSSTGLGMLRCMQIVSE